jgi:hypothetical protein
MSDVIYKVSREYIEGVLEKKLSEEEWKTISDEVVDEIEAVMYDTVLTIKYKWDELFDN